MNCPESVRAEKGSHHREQPRSTHDYFGFYPFSWLAANILFTASWCKHRMTAFTTFLKQTVPDIPLGAVVEQGIDDLPFALGAVLTGLNLLPGQGMLAKVAVDVVDEGAYLI